MSGDAYHTIRTEDLVTYVHGERTESAPRDVGDDLRRRVIDTLAAIISGFRVDGGSLATAHAVDTFAGSGSTVLDGTGTELGAIGASYANAMAANALDIDDGNRIAEGHPAAVLVPAGLAVAEQSDARVRTFLDALLGGYEIAVRTKLALHERVGMHTSSGSWGAVGAAAVVARLLEYDEETTADALGIAEFNAPLSPVMRSVSSPSSSMTKDGIGWGSHLGVSAAMLADRGFTGSGTVFDEIEWTGLERISIPPFNDTYLLTEGYYKPYPACRWIHSGIDATLELLEQHGLTAEDIDAVNVYSHRKAIGLTTRRPSSSDAAQYSYPYMLAVTLLAGDWLTPEHLTDEWRGDPVVHDLTDRIELHLDPDAEDRYPDESCSRVELITDDDRFASPMTHPRGSRERPMTDEDHRTKQALYIDRYVGDGTASQLHSILEDPDAPISELVDLVSAQR